MSLLMKGKSQSTTNRSITRQKLYDTLLWQWEETSSSKKQVNSKLVFHLQLLAGVPPFK